MNRKKILAYFTFISLSIIFFIIVSAILRNFESRGSFFYGLQSAITAFYLFPIMLLLSIVITVKLLFEKGARLRIGLKYLVITLFLYFLFGAIFLEGALFPKLHTFLVSATPSTIKCNLKIKNGSIDAFERDKCYLYAAKRNGNENICFSISDKWYSDGSAKYFSSIPIDSMKRDCFGAVAYLKKDLSVCDKYDNPQYCVDYYNLQEMTHETLNNNAYDCNKIIDKQLIDLCLKYKNKIDCYFIDNNIDQQQCFNFNARQL